VAIAQVQVDDAFWTFTTDKGQELGHLGRTTVRVPYPWVEGETHVLRVLTSTGTPFDHEIAVAVETPTVSMRFLGVFTLIGLYVGVLPVAIGLLWFPFLARLSARGMDFLLALTIGLLAFLLVDGAMEGLEASALLPESFQGGVLFVLAAAGAYLLLEWVSALLKSRRRTGSGGWVLADMIAVGIGLHNFGEGLAIGSAFALGEATLGTLLIIGFTLHNTTEGLAIIAPIAADRPSIPQLVRLGLIGGVPTVAGAWIGGLLYSPTAAVVFLGLGAGAIAQVIVQLAPTIRDAQGRLLHPIAVAGMIAGIALMFVTGLLVAV
jgi:zinc transporter ZupT